MSVLVESWQRPVADEVRRLAEASRDGSETAADDKKHQPPSRLRGNCSVVGPQPRRASSLMRAALCCSLGLFVVLLASTASAQDKTIGLLDVSGGRGDANTRVLREALERAGYEVRDQMWLQARASSLGVSLDNAIDEPEAMAQIAQGNNPGSRLDAVLVPFVENPRTTLVVSVRDGVSGDAVGEETFALRRGVLVSNQAARGVEALGPLLAKTGLWDRKTLKDPVVDKKPDPIDDRPAPTPRPGPQKDDGADWIDVSAGMVAFKRDYAVSSNTEGLEYSSAFYPGFTVTADIFPLVLATDGWASGLGLHVHVTRGFDTVKVIGDAGGELSVPVRHGELGGGLLYKIAVADSLDLRLGAGYDTVDFVLADNPIYSSTRYRATWLSIGLDVSLSNELAIEAGIVGLPLVSLGDSEKEFGTSSSTVGAAANLGLSYDVIAGLYAHTGYRVRAFSTTFEGEGLRGLADVEATDIFHDFTFWVGYRL